MSPIDERLKTLGIGRGCIFARGRGNLKIVRKRQYYGDNNELVELSICINMSGNTRDRSG